MIKLKDKLLLRSRAFINNAWTDSKIGARIPVTNPATGETIGTVPDMGTAYGIEGFIEVKYLCMALKT